MRLLDTLALKCFLVVCALASPFPPANLFSREDSSRAINASVTDHNGKDITSSFQIMIYQEPAKVAALTNLTDRRRQSAVLSRPIMDCPMVGSVFVDSVCTYEDGRSNGMRAWELSCYIIMTVPDPSTGQYRHTYPVLARRTGFCRHDEICVDGLGRGGGSRHGQHSVASCVSTDWFVRMIQNSGKPASERNPLVDLSRKQIRLMASDANGSTPIEVDTLDITALDGEGNAVQDEKCRDCTELKTGTLGPTTDGLRAQVRLLTTGAAAGILWLAVMSG